ncbi:helix-turn-helix transcriptional regulator [Collinsella sp. An2]|uniref:helix-turn-helix transcriptional regulator n=1 Tax=Collinsella sp. An2 TaxID=1965585 RepID=UPI000B3742E2|nr:helix-turn-helix transcriptional regulator [Collinsella sp. An2]OUP08685.1 hypothetical protein B5F33_06630 [Collinsella sp. An2]
MHEAVAAMIPLVDFLETVLGSNNEIVLHDFSDLEHSVVDIRNGRVSGRSTGAPATDFVLKVLNDEAFAAGDHTASYLSHSVAGKPLRSASYFIRENDKIVGMLCINTDTSLIDELERLTTKIGSVYHAMSKETTLNAEDAAASVEHFSTSTDELVQRCLSTIETSTGKPVAAFSADDRLDAVRQMDADGVFLLKGAVAQVAETMGISEPSVYRYLQKIRRA